MHPLNTLDELVAISRHYGGDPSFVLAGGGNTSMKTDETLWVKGSGHALATIGPEGFVEMDRSALEALLERELSADSLQREQEFTAAIMASRLHPELGQRPSVECVLHHLLPARLVVHTHSTVVNTITCCTDGERLAQQILGDDLLWVPYVDPGYVLARTLHTLLKDYQARFNRNWPPVILMQNHGLIVCGSTADEIDRVTVDLLAKIKRHSESMPHTEPFGPQHQVAAEDAVSVINQVAPALRALLATGHRLKVVTFDDSSEVMQLVAGESGRKAISAGPLTPDQIVYCKSFPLWFEPVVGERTEQLVERLRAAVKQHQKESRFLPNVVFVRGVGMFTAGIDAAAANTVRLVQADAIKLMTGSRHHGGTTHLVPQQYRFIEDWEVESYRLQVSTGAGGAGRAAGKVALVTGGAQGFGLEIGRALAAEGAHVAFTDMNQQGAERAAAECNELGGKERALGIAIDVTQGGSVQAALHQVVRQWGGFDLIISNAGVLKAGSVKQLSEKDFDFVTNVNYKGYFVVVQHAAPLMAVQHLAKPDYLSDIIQINSKSGLVGSNKNGAYAGSKFGGIGLTESFALELIEDGIKVNSICPGNFFDGPLWSDPVNGLFVQYLNTGKVPGAKTVDDVRRFYESKVPMGRGCEAADVMRAIYYLMEQQYETGQALPVTGGQVMLH